MQWPLPQQLIHRPGLIDSRFLGPEPDWLLEHERTFTTRLAQLKELRAPGVVLNEHRRRARRHH